MKPWLLMLTVLVLMDSMGFAQDPKATHTLTSGNVDNGFLFAPDLKLTEVNGDFSTLAGGYGGWVINKKFLIGGGVYTLTSGARSSDLTYGGGVLEYFLNQSSLVNVSLRGLIGGGRATLDNGFFGFRSDRRPGPDFNRGVWGSPGLRGIVSGIDLDDRFDLDGATSASFLVAEPEIDVILNVSERVRVSVGGSYRFIGGAGRLQDRLDGLAANVAVKMSFF